MSAIFTMSVNLAVLRIAIVVRIPVSGNRKSPRLLRFLGQVGTRLYVSNGKVLFTNLINIHKKNKVVIAGIKLTIICFANFKLNPKSYEMYNSNPTFPVGFSSHQGFFNI